MDDDSLIKHLGRICKARREAVRVGGRKISLEDLAVMSRGSRYAETSDGLRRNALDRFEHGRYDRSWPRNPDYIVALYANALDVSERVLWEAALLSKHGPQTDAEQDEAVLAAKAGTSRSPGRRTRPGTRRRPA